jgi:hypothetical protein
VIGGAHAQVAVNTCWLSVPYPDGVVSPPSRQQNYRHKRAGLGALGWSIGVGDRDPERQQVVVAKLRADGVDAFPVPIDVTDDATVAAAAR